jgi:hypothetical protein
MLFGRLGEVLEVVGSIQSAMTRDANTPEGAALS